MTPYRIVTILLLVVGISACSVKFAYNNLDRLVRWQVSDYVDLDAAQRAIFKKEFDQILSWHRTTHLPQYAAMARKVSVQLVDAPTVGTLDAMFVQMFAWADEIEVQTMPMVIKLMVSLSDAQLEALGPRLQERNEEWAEDEADLALEEVQERWAKEYADGLKTFVGRLNKQQRAYVVERAAQYQPQMVLWRQYRERFQTALLELLEERKTPEFAHRYTALIERRESFYGDVLSQTFAHNEKLGIEIAAHLFSTLTEKQTTHFVDRLTSLSEDFEELSSET